MDNKSSDTKATSDETGNMMTYNGLFSGNDAIKIPSRLSFSNCEAMNKVDSWFFSAEVTQKVQSNTTGQGGQTISLYPHHEPPARLKNQ